jgi:Zn-finger nucleic acid-binding protein
MWRTRSKERSLELKYCERCGGLWLRPTGGEQIYCTNCARAMAELPPPSTEVKRTRIPRSGKWTAEDDVNGNPASGTETDVFGGVA